MLEILDALDIDQKENGAFVLRVLTDSPDAVISVNLAPEVPDLLLNLVPQKMRLVGIEALQT